MSDTYSTAITRVTNITHQRITVVKAPGLSIFPGYDLKGYFSQGLL